MRKKIPRKCIGEGRGRRKSEKGREEILKRKQNEEEEREKEGEKEKRFRNRGMHTVKQREREREGQKQTHQHASSPRRQVIDIGSQGVIDTEFVTSNLRKFCCGNLFIEYAQIGVHYSNRRKESIEYEQNRKLAVEMLPGRLEQIASGKYGGIILVALISKFS